MIVATYFFKESVNKSFIQVRNAVAALNAFVQEHISGMQVVQAFAAEEKEMKKFIFNFGYPQISKRDMHLFLGLYTCFTP